MRTQFDMLRVALCILCCFSECLNNYLSTMAHHPKWALSNAGFLMKPKKQCWENSAQWTNHWAQHNEPNCAFQDQRNIKKPMFEQAFQNAWNVLKRHLHAGSRYQGRQLSSRLFWSYWTFLSREQCKRMRVRRRPSHEETALQSFQKAFWNGSDLNRFIAKERSSVSIWSALWYSVSDRVISVVVLNLSICFVSITSLTS